VSEAVDPAADYDCDEVQELLPLVADGAITAEDDPQLFVHLAACPDCQSELLTHDLVELALAQGRKPAETARASVIQYQVPWPVAAAATLLLATGVGLWIGNGQGTAEPEQVVAADQGDAMLDVLGGDRLGDPPMFVLRNEGEIHVIDQSQVDGGAVDLGVSPVVPAVPVDNDRREGRVVSPGLAESLQMPRPVILQNNRID
jgi:hypothetical protein